MYAAISKFERHSIVDPLTKEEKTMENAREWILSGKEQNWAALHFWPFERGGKNKNEKRER